MLISLFVRNFRRFDEAGIDFNTGVNGIFGANYQGKTTLLLAIAVALAGPAWARGFNLVKRGQDNFELQLVIELESGRYRIVRSNSGAKLFKVEAGGDRLLANQQGNVNAELARLIGMPMSRFLELRYIRQKQAATMFEAGATKLNTLVEELTGVNTISNVIEQLGLQLKTMSGKLDGLREGCLSDEDLAHFQEEVAKCADDIASLEAESKKVEEGATALSTEVAKVRDQAEDKVAKTREARKSSQARVDAEQALEVAKQAFDAAQKGQPELDLSDLEEKINACRADAVRINELISEAKPKASANVKAQADKLFAEEQVKKTAAELETSTLPAEELDEYEAAADAHEKAERELGDSERDLKRQIAELSEALENGVCKSCKRPFDTDAEHREKQAAQLEAVKAQLTKVQDKQRELGEAGEELHKVGLRLQAQVDQHNAAVKAANDAKADLARKVATAEAELKSAEAAIEAVEKASGTSCETGFAAAQERARHLQAEGDKLSSVWNAENAIRRELQRVSAALANAQSDLAELPSDTPTTEAVDKMAEEANELLNQLTALNGKLEAQEARKGHLARELAAVRKAMESVGGMLSKNSERLEAVTALEAEVANVESLRKFLRENRSRYLQAAWTLIMARASTFADSTTEGFISEIRRTEQGSFEFVENGEVAQVCDASGAQAAIMGIAVQVALAETVPSRLNLLLADEPTADMDAEHSSAVALALSAVSKQVVLISHHRMDESVCDEVMEL